MRINPLKMRGLQPCCSSQIQHCQHTCWISECQFGELSKFTQVLSLEKINNVPCRWGICIPCLQEWSIYVYSWVNFANACGFFCVLQISQVLYSFATLFLSVVSLFLHLINVLGARVVWLFFSCFEKWMFSWSDPFVDTGFWCVVPQFAPD